MNKHRLKYNKETSPKIKIQRWKNAKCSAYDIRLAVFIREHHVPENMEFDLEDESAWHALAYLNNNCIGTARLNVDNQIGKIGRMAVLSQYRGMGVGRQLIQSLLKYGQSLDVNKYALNAQLSAIRFYEKIGFEVIGNIFQEVGIAHQKMVLNLLNKF